MQTTRSLRPLLLIALCVTTTSISTADQNPKISLALLFAKSPLQDTQPSTRSRTTTYPSQSPSLQLVGRPGVTHASRLIPQAPYQV